MSNLKHRRSVWVVEATFHTTKDWQPCVTEFSVVAHKTRQWALQKASNFRAVSSTGNKRLFRVVRYDASKP